MTQNARDIRLHGVLNVELPAWRYLGLPFSSLRLWVPGRVRKYLLGRLESLKQKECRSRQTLIIRSTGPQIRFPGRGFNTGQPCELAVARVPHWSEIPWPEIALHPAIGRGHSTLGKRRPKSRKGAKCATFLFMLRA
jgi:hypothetical protein